MGNNILIWLLAVVVLLSLGFSVAALILQIRRDRIKKQAPVANTKTNMQGSPPVHPMQSNQSLNAIKQQGQWQPPAWRYDDDYGDRTEALFSYPHSSPNIAVNEHFRQPQRDAYQIFIREKGQMEERSYDVVVSGEFPIGRTVKSGLQIENKTVSGLQCVLIAAPDNVFVSNRSNSNVTKLNGVMLNETSPLMPGDTLGMGNIQLSILDIRKHAAR